MRKRKRRPRQRKLLERQGEPIANERVPTQSAQSQNKQGPFYRSGPVFNLGTIQATEEDELAGASQSTEVDPAVALSDDEMASDAAFESGMLDDEQEAVGPAPSLSGAGATSYSVAFANTSLTLQGRTDATFDGGSFQTENVEVRPGEGCEGCTDGCVHVTGTLVATYHVTTSVTLPSVNDFPDLTPCQRARVQDAISNVLAPHEQEHVRAFQQYNGTTRRPFDMTLCRSDFDGRIQAMFDTDAASRQQTAQAASDALDPFHFDVDLNCEEDDATTEEETTDDAISDNETSVENLTDDETTTGEVIDEEDPQAEKASDKVPEIA